MATVPFNENNVHVDQDLSNFAVAWGSNKFVADMICPVVPVLKKSDTYLQFGMEVFNQEQDHQGDQDYPKEVERTFERKPYTCERHALREWSGDATKNNADAAMSRALSEMAIVEYLKAKILLNKEITVKNLFATTGTYLSGLYENMDSVANRNYDDSSGPGALKLILELKEAILTASGFEPNQMVISSDAWALLSTDSSFFGGGAVKVRATKDEIAMSLGLDEIIVVSSRFTASKIKAKTDPTLGRLWPSNGMWLIYTPKTISFDLPATAKTFQWRSTEQYNVNGEFVGRIRDNMAGDGGDWVIYKQFYVPKLTSLNSDSKIITAGYQANVYIAL